MTDDDRKKLRELAEAVIAKYGADADKPSVHLANGVIALLDENEQLRHKVGALLQEPFVPAEQLAAASAEIERLRASHSAVVRQRLADDLVHAEAALERMTAARDEACDIAGHLCLTSRRDEEVRFARIVELRKVGAK